MRVKVGDQWFEATPDAPVMVELTEHDRLNIANMADWATKYAAFADGDPRSTDERLAWME